MDIAIRKAVVDDIESILKIYAQPSIDDGVMLNLDNAKKIFEIINNYPSYTIYVATINGEVVGTIAVLIMHNIGHLGSKSAVFESIAVLPDWQGKGIGKSMLRFATEKCKEAKCYKITLSANIKRENAHKFYASLGFIQHGISYKYLI
ncbi:MAG: GNAT family N-acetyltransferase [Desulfopila sp.]|jgi:GNAT superfamily N-acetyltransferase|nr:GNAT family N-acetyltransferase [Desulfopila sp.]